MTAVARHISDPDRSLARQLNVRSLPSGLRAGLVLAVALALLWPLAPLAVAAASAEAWSSQTVSAAWFSLWQAIVAATVGIALSLPIGWALARCAVPARRLIRSLLTAPIVTSVLALALGASWLLSDSWPILLLVNTGFGLAVGVRLGDPAWATLDPREVETARTLGLTRGQVLRWHVLPTLGRPVVAAWALASALAISAFGSAHLLAAPRPTLTELTATARPGAGTAEAAGAAVILALVVALALVLFLRWRPEGALAPADEEASSFGQLGVPERGLVVGAFALAIVLVLSPLIALVHAAVTIGASEQITAANVTGLFEAPRPFEVDTASAIRRSILLAVGAVLISIPLGLLVAMLTAPLRGWAATLTETVLFLPLFLPVVLAAGLRDAGLHDPRWLWFVHIGIALPLVVRFALPVARARLRAQFEAATLLGASRWASWNWLAARSLRAHLAVAAVLVLAWSLGEVGAALVLHRLDTAPAAAAIALSLEQQSVAADGRAFALAALLVLFVTILFVTIEYRRSREITEF